MECMLTESNRVNYQKVKTKVKGQLFLSIIKTVTKSDTLKRFFMKLERTRSCYTWTSKKDNNYQCEALYVKEFPTSVWWQYITNTEVRGQSLHREKVGRNNERRGSILIVLAELDLFGYICELDNWPSSRLPIGEGMALGIMESRNQRGRPRREWLDTIDEWCQSDRQKPQLHCTKPSTVCSLNVNYFSHIVRVFMDASFGQSVTIRLAIRVFHGEKACAEYGDYRTMRIVIYYHCWVRDCRCLRRYVVTH